MTEGTPFHIDLQLDTFGEDDDGNKFLYASANPERRYAVVSMLDDDGDETDDHEIAFAGVVKIAEDAFVVFLF
jgi:hypothetical protein